MRNINRSLDWMTKNMKFFEPSENYDDNGVVSALVADFDADPEFRQMLEESERAIENGQVFSTKQVIEMIKSGKI